MRYIPGPRAGWEWGEAFVEDYEDGRVPQYYLHNNIRYYFAEPLAHLIARGAWQRADDPDLDMDIGL